MDFCLNLILLSQKLSHLSSPLATVIDYGHERNSKPVFDSDCCFAADFCCTAISGWRLASFPPQCCDAVERPDQRVYADIEDAGEFEQLVEREIAEREYDNAVKFCLLAVL